MCYRRRIHRAARRSLTRMFRPRDPCTAATCGETHAPQNPSECKLLEPNCYICEIERLSMPMGKRMSDHYIRDKNSLGEQTRKAKRRDEDVTGSWILPWRCRWILCGLWPWLCICSPWLCPVLEPPKPLTWYLHRTFPWHLTLSITYPALTLTFPR